MSSLRQLKSEYEVLSAGIPAGWSEDQWVDKMNEIRTKIKDHPENQKDTYNHQIVQCTHMSLPCILFGCVHALPHEKTKSCNEDCEIVVTVTM